jgi:hypothetical protein
VPIHGGEKDREGLGRKLMRLRLLIVVALFSMCAASSGAAQGARAAALPRTSDGKPDMSGFWQVLNTANFDIQDHQARPGVPAGQGIVEGNEDKDVVFSIRSLWSTDRERLFRNLSTRA